MGAGKTTVGRQLAKRLGREFFDSDHEIASRTGVGIPVVFEIEGEAGFRARERRVIEELSRLPGIVMATGGGAVLAVENRRTLRETGTVVYLHAPPRILFERTRHDRNRPLLQVEDPLARLTALYVERDPLYREVAHFVIDCKAGSAAQLAQSIETRLKSLCVP